MDNNRTWEALSMKDRASFIKLAIQNGYKDINSIRDLYNNRNIFRGGGKVEKNIPVFNRENMPGYSQKTIDRLNYNNTILDTIPATRRAALLSAEFHESNLDPNAVGDGGKALGLLQVHPNRRANLYNKKGTDKEMIDNQSTAIVDALSGRDPNRDHWTHGGKGSGFNSWKDAQNTFYDSNSSLEEINRALNRGFVRPHNAEQKTKERLKTAEAIYNIIGNNRYDEGGYKNDYNAVLYNGEITVPIEEIPITGSSGLNHYKPGTKDYINQIRKFTDRIYSGDLAIDAVPEYYRKGVQNTLRGDQFANKVIKSRDEDYRVLRNAMTAIPLLTNPYSAHVAKVMMNPMSAMTEAGAATATLIDAAGAAYGLNQNIDLLGKAIKGNATWEDTINFGLNTLGMLPYSNNIVKLKKVDLSPITIKKFIDSSKKYIGNKLGYIEDINKHRNPNSHFRIVDKPAIDDAKNSGLIRAKTGLYHDTPEFIKEHFSEYIKDIPNWEQLDANILREILEKKGAFNGMTKEEIFNAKLHIRNSTNQGNTVHYFKGAPYPNYKVSSSNFVIETPERPGIFVAGHAGKEFSDVPIEKAGATLLKTNGNIRGAQIPSKGSYYWEYSPFWKMWIKKKFALGGPLYNQNNPIESFQGNPYIPVVRY